MSLKEFFFKISFLYKFLPTHFLMKLARKKSIAIFYHYIKKDTEDELTSHLYKAKNITQFLEDIHYLKKHFRSISIEEFLQKKYKKDYTFFLSFDDGLSNFYDVVAPILKQEKVQAINFLNSGFIDNKELFYRYKINFLIDFILRNDIDINKKRALKDILALKEFHLKNVVVELTKMNIHQTKKIDKLLRIINFSEEEYLLNNTPYLTQNQILELKQDGFYIGAHSKTHPRYENISLKKQIEETLTSVQEITNRFDLKKQYFAFPFSDDGVTKHFFNEIKSKVTATFGTAGLKDECIDFHYQRIPMEYNSVYSAETIIKTELVYYIFKKIIGYQKIKRN